LTKVLLIRHAESEGNIYRRAHGHHNGLITERGYKQIEKLKARYAGKQINAVYSSDLFRARTTAAAISIPHQLQINTTDVLREVGLGEWEDKAWGDIEYENPAMSSNFNRDPSQWSVSGSESYEDVQARMSYFIKETARRHEGGTIAIFSHGFAIRSLLCLLEGIPSHETVRMPYCDNTGVNILIYDNGELRVDEHGDNSHLANEHSTLAHQSWWRTERKMSPENLRFVPLKEAVSGDLMRVFQAKAGERAHVDKQYAAFLVDEPVGILGIDSERDRKSSIGWISYIHIIPARRRKNFGTQLLGLAVSDFRKLHRERLRIELPAGSQGSNFMARCGFKILDITDNVCLMEKGIKNW